MASIGNNTNGEIADFRDAFMTPDEKEYNSTLNRYMDVHGMYVGMATTPNIDVAKKRKISSVAYNIIDKMDNLSVSDKALLCGMITGLLAIDLCGSNEVWNITALSNIAKVILAQALNDCVEQGLFTEEEMVLVENTMNILLGSIEDLHMEQIKERSFEDDDILSR